MLQVAERIHTSVVPDSINSTERVNAGSNNVESTEPSETQGSHNNKMSYVESLSDLDTLKERRELYIQENIKSTAQKRDINPTKTNQSLKSKILSKDELSAAVNFYNEPEQAEVPESIKLKRDWKLTRDQHAKEQHRAVTEALGTHRDAVIESEMLKARFRHGEGYAKLFNRELVEKAIDKANSQLPLTLKSIDKPQDSPENQTAALGTKSTGSPLKYTKRRIDANKTIPASPNTSVVVDGSTAVLPENDKTLPSNQSSPAAGRRRFRDVVLSKELKVYNKISEFLGKNKFKDLTEKQQRRRGRAVVGLGALAAGAYVGLQLYHSSKTGVVLTGHNSANNQLNTQLGALGGKAPNPNAGLDVPLGAFGTGGGASHATTAAQNLAPHQTIVHLKSGSNPWEVARRALQEEGNSNPTNAQIQNFDLNMLQNSGIPVDQAPYLPDGTILKYN